METTRGTDGMIKVNLRMTRSGSATTDVEGILHCFSVPPSPSCAAAKDKAGNHKKWPTIEYLIVVVHQRVCWEESIDLWNINNCSVSATDNKFDRTVVSEGAKDGSALDPEEDRRYPLPPSGRVSPAREWVRVQSDTHPQGATSLSRL